jgi:histidinol-phosphate aminotransferase
VIATRERVQGRLSELGFELTDSKANFIFATHPEVRAESIFRQLKDRGILVRYFRLPRIDNHIRISIGTDTDMEHFLNIMRFILYN